MKLQALAALCSVAIVNANALQGQYAGPFGHHAHVARQAADVAAAGTPSGSAPAASGTTAPASTPSAPAAPPLQVATPATMSTVFLL